MARWWTLIAASFVTLVVLLIVFGVGNSLASHTYDDAKSTPNAITVERPSAFAVTEASYTDPDHQVEKLQHCARPLIGRTTCESTDGKVIFSYTLYKGTITRANVMVDTVTHKLHCYRVKDGSNLRSRVCLPAN